jgi:purine-nucleoside phosphorylase
MTPLTPSADAIAAAALIAARSGIDQHEVAIVTGSGWIEAADLFGQTIAEIPFDEIPGFVPTSVPGHSGVVRSMQIGNRRVLVFVGRSHLYEGHSPDIVTHYVHTAAAVGANVLILTNGAGSLRADWTPGTTVLIRDHINHSGKVAFVGPHFVDLTDAYSPRLRSVARSVDANLSEGVYVQVHGPAFETPAEITMFATMGAELVGMSTALEVVAARALGLEVLAVSLVTNLAAGMTPSIDHSDVIAAGQAAATNIAGLITALVPLV